LVEFQNGPAEEQLSSDRQDWPGHADLAIQKRLPGPPIRGRISGCKAYIVRTNYDIIDDIICDIINDIIDETKNIPIIVI
jgi:hypothetical protein